LPIFYFNFIFAFELLKRLVMYLEGILSISGQSGLFKLISKGKSSVIVESLVTGKKMPAFSTSRISTLEDVAVYTDDGEIPLKDIFNNIFKKYEGKKIDNSVIKNNNYLEFFETVLPNFDRDRVYQSDVKKIVNWYNCLVDNNILNENSVKESEESKENNKETIEQASDSGKE